MTGIGLMPCLFFATEAEEAATLYLAACPGATEVDRTFRPDGKLLVSVLQIGDNRLMLMNGNLQPGFAMGLSLVVSCRDQAELDRCWDALLAGGTARMCGWLTDRFGVSWQVIPASMGTLMGGDREAAARAHGALMQMVKIDIAGLERARAS